MTAKILRLYIRRAQHDGPYFEYQYDHMCCLHLGPQIFFFFFENEDLTNLSLVLFPFFHILNRYWNLFFKKKKNCYCYFFNSWKVEDLNFDIFVENIKMYQLSYKTLGQKRKKKLLEVLVSYTNNGKHFSKRKIYMFLWLKIHWLYIFRVPTSNTILKTLRKYN